MASKFKITGIGRLFIFLIIFAPIAYIGAGFINGENGFDKIKGLFGGGVDKIEKTVDDSDLSDRNEKIIRELRKENAQLKRQVRDLEAELGR